MITKLTLTMEKTVIEKAKEYAHSRNNSVSKLVEDYLNRISSADRPWKLDALDTSFVDSMAGIIPDDGRDYKELLDEARIDWFKGKGFDIEDLK